MHTSSVKVLRGPITRLWVQSSGGLLSADRTAAGRETNRMIADRLAHHRVRVFGV
jgi:hypothetical protein